MVQLAGAAGAFGGDPGERHRSAKTINGAQPGSRPARRTVAMEGFGVLADGTSFCLSILDLSYEGCRVESPVALFPGVKFKMSVLGFRGVIDALVRWHKDGVAGIEFCTEEPAERKQVPRSHDRCKVEGLVALRRMGRKQYQTRLFDVTPNGCKVEFIERPRAGELLWAKLADLVTVEASVRWVDGFYGGIEFVRPIHPAVFDSLVQRLNA